MRRRVVAAILAEPTALFPWAGSTRLRTIAREVCASSCERVAVILGASPARVSVAVEGLPIVTLANVLWSEGIASALRCAAGWALRSGADGLLVVHGDQPRVDRIHVESLLGAFRTSPASHTDNDVTEPAAVFGVESFAKLARLGRSPT